MATRVGYFEQPKRDRADSQAAAKPVDNLGKQPPIEFSTGKRGRKIHVTPYGRVHEVNGRKAGWRTAVTALGAAAITTLAITSHGGDQVAPGSTHDPAIDKMSPQQIDQAAQLAQERGEIPADPHGVVEVHAPQLPDGSIDSSHN